MCQMHTELKLECFTKDMGAGMPESLFTFSIIELVKFDLAIAFQRARCIVFHPSLTNVALLFLWVLKRVIKSSDAAIWVAYFGNDDLFSELV